MTSAYFTSKDIATTKDEIDVERHFLGTTVTLSDGTEGLVFSRGCKNESGYFLYNCHLCGVVNLPGERSLQTHITGKKHQIKLSQHTIDADLFRIPLTQKNKIQMNIAPGEPVPPGFENEVKAMPEIQGFINKYKEHALIGVEYCLELNSRGMTEPSYICLLCDRRGDPRTIISHWTSYNHRLKYLEKHFPSVIKELVPYRYNPEARNVMPRLIQTIVEAIEHHHGRLSPTVVDNSEFKRNRNKIMQEIISEKHFDEKNGPSFLNVIDKKMIDNLIKGSKSIPINLDTTKKHESTPTDVKSSKRVRSDLRKDRDSLDSISSDSDIPSSNSPVRQDKNKRKKSQSPAYRIISRVKRSPPFEEEPKPEKKSLPTPRELSMQASEIANERYKWEKYRCLVEIAVRELEKTLNEYEKSPEKHPLYPEEWKKFWNRRYKELQLEKKDPNKYDFKPEWIIFWTKRMRELHDEEVEMKKIEIKKKLGFTENAEEKTDQLKQQYKVKTPTKTDKPLAVIDISDDDESISSHRSTKSLKKRSRSRSRSLSSLSDEYGRKTRGRTRSRGKESDKEKHRDRERDSYYTKEREIATTSIRDRYGAPSIEYFRHLHQRPGYYPVSHPSHYSSYRTMESYNIPQYEPKAPLASSEKEDSDDGPLTAVAVLRLLTALEDHLGSLGPKVVDLLAKALALEKVKANSSDEMLLNDDNCVFFETVKEKLKGQLIADVLDSHKIKAVKKAIKNIAAIIHQVNNKAKEKIGNENEPKDNTENENKKITTKNDDILFDRQLVVSKLAAALVVQEKTDVSTDDMNKLIHVFVLMVKESKNRGNIVEIKDFLIELGIVNQDEDIRDYKETNLNESIQEQISNKEFSLDIFDPNDDEDDGQPQSSSGALESLTDSDLQTLLQNFKHLSSEEQHHLIAHLKKLESSDPVRVEKLRKFVDLSDIKQGKEKSPLRDTASKDMKTKKVVSIYSDDEDVKLQKVVDSDDDDDDDYNFDEVVKAASNNIKDSKQNNESQRPHSLNKDPDMEISNMSKASSISTTNVALTDTQNIIANLMGSLQKNSQAYQSGTPSTLNTNNGNAIPTVVSSQNSNRDTHLPFYQQISQKQQTHSMNPIFPSVVNTNFQNNDVNTNNTLFNQQTCFNSSQHQQLQPPQMQTLQANAGGLKSNLSMDLNQLNTTQVKHMISSFLAQQQNQQNQHRFQHNPMGGQNQGTYF